MRVVLLLLTLSVLASCASHEPQPQREIASEEIIRLGKVDLKKSIVQIFPAVANEEKLWYYFYLQLKNSQGEFVDIDPTDIKIKTTQNKNVKFKLERLLAGRYYVTMEKTVDVSSIHLNFFVQGVALKEQFKLHMRYPSKVTTKISVVEDGQNKITFALRLADRLNQPVEVPERPEIILDGNGIIEDVKHIHEGIWHFSVIYPEDNQIMYFSIRAMGVYLPRIYRHQHVEK